MFKVLISIAISLTCSGAFSSKSKSSIYWKLIYESKEAANDSDGFKVMQQKYPELLSNIDASTVAYANLVSEKYKYTGHTTCTNDDPRLIFESTYYSGCTISSFECFANTILLPPFGDPCDPKNK